jgi:hypothetical protein
LSFTVTLTGSTTVAASVDFEAQEGTADAGADFAEASGTITFTPGDTSETITVDALDDVDLDPNEIFHVVLSNATNAVIDDGTGVGTIGDTDVDTDDDELSDDAEAQLGTDPNDADTDDGLDDLYDSFFADPNDPDTDDDGLSDLTEVVNGTDPNDPNDPGSG